MLAKDPRTTARTTGWATVCRIVETVLQLIVIYDLIKRFTTVHETLTQSVPNGPQIPGGISILSLKGSSLNLPQLGKIIRIMFVRSEFSETYSDDDS